MSCLFVEKLDLEEGTSARLKATLAVNCIPVNGTVTLTVRDPNGNLSYPSVAQMGIGSYYTDIEVDLPGQWKYRWESTDPIAAQEGSFIVRRSQLL